MPPPMSMVQYDFQSNIIGIAKRQEKLSVVTEDRLYLYDMIKNVVKISVGL